MTDAVENLPQPLAFQSFVLHGPFLDARGAMHAPQEISNILNGWGRKYQLRSAHAISIDIGIRIKGGVDFPVPFFLLSVQVIGVTSEMLPQIVELADAICNGLRCDICFLDYNGKREQVTMRRSPEQGGSPAVPPVSPPLPDSGPTKH